jgi:hypothetical protein
VRSAGGKHVWPVPAGVRSCAIYSTDPQKDYRYVLYRSWSMSKTPLAVFVGLNPSTAQARFDDPTVQKCWMWARDRGFGRFAMLNLFAWRATDQRELWANTNDPIGPRNDEYIRETVLNAALVVAAWGNGQRRRAAVEARAADVRAMLEQVIDVNHLGLTKRGHPRHPLYVAKSTMWKPWA